MKRGDKFLHKHWIDNDGHPLVCIVAAVRYGRVYWKTESEKKSYLYFYETNKADYAKEMIHG